MPDQNDGPVMQEAQRQQTLGEQRTRVSFNPSQNPQVDDIKRTFAAILDQLNGMRIGDSMLSSEQHRCIAEAMTRVEDAAMWTVKAMTA